MGYEFRICLYNEPILREKGALVKNHQDPNFQDLATKMVEQVANDDNAIGLAAQQIGHALQLCIVNLKDNPKYIEKMINAVLDGKPIPLDLLFPLVITNPILTIIGDETSIITEHCISLPGLGVPVSRPEHIKLNYQDINGIKHELTCNSLLARCIQHELDHLQGILTIDHAQPNVINALNSKLKRLKRDTRDFLKNTKVNYVKYDIE